MTREEFFAKFELFAELPNAVPKMRELILQLAVRGELVPQDQRDESGHVLLKRIIATGRGLQEPRSRRDLNDGDVAKPFFEIPDTWTWTVLGVIGEWGSGSTPARNNGAFYGGGVTWLKSGELNNNPALSGSSETITEVALAAGSFRRNKPGDVLIAMYGATLGKVALLTELAVTNQAVCGCTPVNGVLARYLFNYLISQRSRFEERSEGGAQPNISKVKLLRFPFPLPPLAEQKRIVAKVDELMAFCDQLEAQQKERETRHAALARASLSHFASVPTPANLTLLFHNSYAIATADFRKVILALAVEGKLVAQKTSDEAADHLYARIRSVKARLHGNGRINRSSLGSSLQNNGEMSLPMGWVASRLGEVFDVRDGTHDTPKYTATGFPLITSKNISSGRLSFDDIKLISETEHHEIAKRSRVDRGDILFAMIGSIGNPVTVDTDRQFSIKNVALFKYYSVADAESGFLLIYLKHVAEEMRAKAAGAVQSFVSLNFLRNYFFPLPPLAEQRRIVSKVDQLMALVDDLETQLGALRATATTLLDTSTGELTS